MRKVAAVKMNPRRQEYHPPSPPTHRGRIQAQGPGTEESVPWARDTPPTKSEMLEYLDQLWAKLSPTEQTERVACFADARKYIQHAPANGIAAPFSKSSRNRKRRGGVRIDLEIRGGRACVD